MRADDIRAPVTRDYLEARLDHLKVLIDKLDAEVRARLDGSDKALLLQAEEYNRRLDILNNEHERAQRTRDQTVNIQLFQRFEQEWTVWRRGIDALLSAMGGREQGLGLAWSVGIALVGVALAMATVWWRGQP